MSCVGLASSTGDELGSRWKESTLYGTANYKMIVPTKKPVTLHLIFLIWLIPQSSGFGILKSSSAFN